MSVDDLAAFQAAVLDDAGLQRDLLGVPDRRAFVARVVTLARSHGQVVTPLDVEEALRRSRDAWNQRWV